MTETRVGTVPSLDVLGEGAPLVASAVGGKAESLDRMLRLGLDVPAGFCVPVAAYRSYFESAGLEERARELRERLPATAAREELARLTSAAPLPPELRQALEDRLSELAERCGEETRLAVRSSAVDEDGTHASFAGAHESLLDVACEAGAVEAAVRTCWASLWSARAVSYRIERGLTLDPAMVVVVQQLAGGVASAVAFTKHPVTGSRADVVVCCTAGLGEEMMAGGGDATTITVHKATREIVEIEGEDGPWPISIAALNSIVEAALALENEYLAPVDVEAAYDGRRWLLVQSRPITT